MTKEELNIEIEKLKVSLEAHEEQVKDLSHDLKTAKQRLEETIQQAQAQAGRLQKQINEKTSNQKLEGRFSLRLKSPSA